MVLNCQSVRPIIHDLMDKIKTKNVDICLLNETWIKKPGDILFSTVNNYSYHMFHSKKFGRCKGTAILISKSVSFDRVFTSSYDHIKSFDLVVLKLNRKINTTLVCIYRYGKLGRAFNNFLTEFTDLLSQLVLTCDSLIICGDFNLHWNEQASSEIIRFKDTLDEFGLKCCNPSPHVPTHKLGNTIDLVLCNEASAHLLSCVTVENHVRLSDHYPLLFSFQTNCNIIQSLQAKSQYRKFRSMNMESFKDDISNSLNNIIDSSQEFETAITKYTKSMTDIIEKHAPLQSKTVSTRCRPPWMDREYIDERAKRRKLEKIYQQSRSLHDLDLLKAQSKLCSRLVKIKRSEDMSKNIAARSGNQKALFKFVSSCSGKHNQGIYPDSYGDKTELVNEFNSFFVEKPLRIRAEMNSLHDTVLQSILPDDNSLVNNSGSVATLSEFTPATNYEIRTLIKEHGIKLSPLDPLPAWLLSENLDDFIPFITYLVNLSLKGNIDGLKKAIVKPLLKNNNCDRNTFNNYRPISNLTFIGKLIERVVQVRLQDHMDKINFNNTTQFGYKKNHSCEMLLLKFLNDVLVGINSRNGVIVMLIDLSAAFDTVDHAKLLNILANELYITGSALRWFRSFLVGRTQTVLIDGHMSEPLELSFGVPQGSILGPILFNIYVKSLSSVFTSNGFSSLSYADDNSGYQIFSLSSQSSVFNSTVPNCIDSIKLWMDSYFLKINESKTDIIVFAKPSFHHGLSNTVVTLNNGDIIEISDRVEYLGVHFDKFLNFLPHINEITSHCYSSLKTIKRMRKHISQKEVEMIVHAVILSRLDYCNSLLFGVQKGNGINKLQRIQNQASKLVLRKGRLQGYSSVRRLDILHWLPIPKRIVFKILYIVFKCFTGNAPFLISSLLIPKMSGNVATHKYDERSFFPSLEIGRRAFVYHAPRLWNCLPIYLRKCETKELFKKQLKTYLWQSYDILINRYNAYRT